MKVSNQKCIRRLSFRFLRANRRRNRIAVFAIALTTLLFTSLFTIALSLNSSYETYQFRQLGGYAHGTFKDVSPEQAERIAAHPNVKEVGARKVVGISTEGVFAKIPAEISYMDVEKETLDRMPKEDIICGVFYEMTFNGFTEEDVEAFFNNLCQRFEEMKKSI